MANRNGTTTKYCQSKVSVSIKISNRAWAQQSLMLNMWNSVRHGQFITGQSDIDRAKIQCSGETLNACQILATPTVQSLSMYRWIAWINTAHHVSYGHKTVDRS